MSKPTKKITKVATAGKGKGYLPNEQAAHGYGVGKPVTWTPQTAAAAAGGAPPTAAPTPTPRANPFYNPQNKIDIANLNFDTATEATAIDTALADQNTNNEFQKTQFDTQAKQQASATADAAAGRGLFGSSITMGQLADIEAQRVVQKSFLDTALSTAVLRGDARKLALRTHATDVMKGIDDQAIANADEINRDIGPPPAAPDASAIHAVNARQPGMNLGNIRADQNPGSAAVQAAISKFNNSKKK